MQSRLPKHQPAVLADTYALVLQPDVAHAGHVAPGVRDCSEGDDIAEVVGGDRAFDLIVACVGWFDVDQAYLVFGVL